MHPILHMKFISEQQLFV